MAIVHNHPTVIYQYPAAQTAPAHPRSWTRDITLILIGAVAYGGVDYLLPKVFDQKASATPQQHANAKSLQVAEKPFAIDQRPTPERPRIIVHDGPPPFGIEQRPTPEGVHK